MNLFRYTTFALSMALVLPFGLAQVTRSDTPPPPSALI